MDLYTPTIGISFDANQFSDALDALLVRDTELQHAHAEQSTHFAPTPIMHHALENGTMETVARYWLMKSIQSHPQLLLFCMKLPAQQLLWLLRNRLIQLYKEETLRIRQAQIDLWREWGRSALSVPVQQFSPDVFGYQKVQEQALTALETHEQMVKQLPRLVHFQYPDTIETPIAPSDVDKVTKWIVVQQELEYRWLNIVRELTHLQSPYVEERPFNRTTIEESEHWLPEQRRLVDDVKTLQEALLPFDISVSLTAPYAAAELAPYRDQLQYWTQRFAEFDRLESLCQELGWEQSWSHAERMTEDLDAWTQTIEQQSGFFDAYKTLQTTAKAMGRRLPALIFPMTEKKFKMHRDRMLFYVQWWTIAQSHPIDDIDSTCMNAAHTELPSLPDLLVYAQALKSNQRISWWRRLLIFFGWQTPPQLRGS